MASRDDSDGDAGGGADSHAGQDHGDLSENGGLHDPFGTGESALFGDVPSSSEPHHGKQSAQLIAGCRDLHRVALQNTFDRLCSSIPKRWSHIWGPYRTGSSTEPLSHATVFHVGGIVVPLWMAPVRMFGIY
eukprot:TRINITY_DN2349_c0_g1_i2.p1 TRINITY_DN2349_c0_g1~~TRINITY_DN2349_c0_g1_i2.p1  ORF type:complete len:132 (+),score=5.97 TRINITY_DN2349_c0_g1_i2:327-722(+)